MYKALKSFSGLVSMRKGEVREISDLSIANDLLKVKYIEEFNESEKASVKKTRSPKRKEKKE